MPYIICNNNEDYLSRDKSNNLILTNLIDESYKWNAITKAENALKGLPRKYDSYNFEVKYISQENKICNSVAIAVELKYDILDKVKEILEFTNELEARRLYLLEKIHDIDLEINDIEHAAEFYVLNASQGYKLYRMLHDARVKRRTYKNELQKIELSIGTSMKKTNMENLAKSIIGVDHKKYSPRVNKELFGV